MDKNTAFVLAQAAEALITAMGMVAENQQEEQGNDHTGIKSSFISEAHT